MNTDKSTVTSKSDLTGFIDEARAAGYETLFNRELAAQAAAAEREAKEAERRAEAWAPALAAIRKATPEWAHQFIAAPTTDLTGIAHNSGYECWWNPVAINLPGCVPINAYSDGQQVIFDPLEPIIMTDDDTGRRAVHSHSRVGRCYNHELEQCEHDFNVAVLKASQFAEAERRMLAQVVAANLKQHPAPTAEAKVETPRDPAAKVLACIAELNLRSGAAAEQGLLYGLIMIGAELRAIRTAAEDIAAAMLADELNEETDSGSNF